MQEQQLEELSQSLIKRFAQSPSDSASGLTLHGIALILEKLGRLPGNYMRDVESFHRKFKIDYQGAPRLLPNELLRFRINRLREELEEFVKASRGFDMEEQLDALIDLTYIALGTAHLMGADFDKGWNLVHTANMQKELATLENPGKYMKIGIDIVKPTGWKKPDLSSCVGL